VAKLRRTLSGFSERAIKRRTKFCGITHYRDVRESVAIECGANSAYPAVHHVARSDNVCTRTRVADGRLRQKLNGFVVQHTIMAPFCDESVELLAKTAVS